MTTSGQIRKFYEADDEAAFTWELSETGEHCYESSRFSVSDTCWSLKIFLDYRNDCNKDALQLMRQDKGKNKNVTIEITLVDGRSPDQEKFRHSRNFGQLDAAHTFYCEKENSLRKYYGRTIVRCYIKLHPENLTESIAAKTNFPETVVENEKPEDSNWPPLDMKGVALLSDRMKDMLNKGNDYDLTIRIKNKEFRAHRNILSARSPVFAMMLTHDTKEKNAGTIDIEDCDPDSFEEFLLHVYSGRNENLTPGKALQLYYPADKYDFPVLKERCVNLLKSSMSITSICDIVLLAAKHAENELLQVATEFFARNMKQILVTVEWQNFMVQNSVEANELLIKSMRILHPEK